MLHLVLLSLLIEFNVQLKPMYLVSLRVYYLVVSRPCKIALRFVIVSHFQPAFWQPVISKMILHFLKHPIYDPKSRLV